MNAIGPIIAKYRKQNHLSQNDLAALLAKKHILVTNKGVSAWEAGKCEPPISTLIALCEILGIYDIYEEMMGSNPMNPLTNLNAEGREKALDYIELLELSGQYSREESPVGSDSTNKRMVPLFDLHVSAGFGNVIDESTFEEIPVPDRINEYADFAVKVTGDSMEPMFQDGQIIFVHKQDSLTNRDIGIFLLNGNTYVKRFQNDKKGIALHSLNKKYPTIPVLESNEFKIFGRVIG